MTTNYLLTSVRSLLRNRFSALINLLGLAAGLCCAIYIMLFAYDEYGYDRFHENAEHIYRFNTQFGVQNERVPLGPYLLDNIIYPSIPEIKETTRIRSGEFMFLWLTDKENIHVDKGIMLADSNFFSFFSFPLLEGHPDQVLQDDHSMVIDRSTAKRLFGDKDPIGEMLYLQGEHPVQITGIMEDMPRQSHFNASIIVNGETIRRFAPDFIFYHYGSFGYNYYLLLEPKADPEHVAASINTAFEEVAPGVAEITDFNLQNLLDIRLRSARIAWDIDTHGNLNLLRGLYAIAIIILLLASVNYINLYTALSARRKKEIGIRKVMGATRGNIFSQSMTESVIAVFIALVLALTLAEIFIPLISELSGKPLRLSWLLSPELLPLIILIFAVVTFLAGFYPALVLGRFQPADILRGGLAGKKLKKLFGQDASLRIRQALIVFQFACTIALIVISLSVNRQLNYMLTIDKGYNQDELFVILNPYDDHQETRFDRLKSSMEQFPSLEVVSAGMNIPTERIGNFLNITMEDGDLDVQSGQINVDPDYFKAVGATLIAGRFFNPDYGLEHENIIINRMAATALGFENPADIIGKDVITQIIEGGMRVVGVIEDIHYFSLHELISPAIYTTGPYQPSYGNILVRSAPGQMAQALRDAETLWNQEVTFYPFDHAVIESRNRELYQREEQTNRLLRLFVGLALVISLMGLFALSSFVMVSRIKEIAVRKVLGAGQKQILMMLGREFSILLLVSSILAWPAAYLITENWLDTFAYRQYLNYYYFALASIISLATVWMTITYHSIKAAATDPAYALKYE